MSTSRANNSFFNNINKPVERTDENHASSVKDNVETYGATLGIKYVLNKFEYIYHAHRESTHLNLMQTIKIASQTRLKGLGVNIFNNLTASVILNATILEFEMHEDTKKHPFFASNSTYAAIGGLAASFATYPSSIIEARRYEGQSFAAIRAMKARHYFNGMPAAGISDCIFNGIYFGFQPIIFNQLNKRNFFPQRETERVADFAAGIVAGFASNPIYMISNCQKMSGLSIVDEARTLFKEGGVKRFYRGFSIIGLLNVGLFALTQGSSFRLAEEYLEHEEKMSNKV